MADLGDTDLDEQLGTIVAAIPAPVASDIDNAVAALAAASSANLVGIGDRAPDFELPDPFGRPVRLSERLGDGPVVLTFYRGDWCPFCNAELRALNAGRDALDERHASLIAISPQLPHRAKGVADHANLAFDVLSDIDQRTIRAYGLQCEVSGDARRLYDEVLRFDLSEHNADHSWTLPIPATYVIDQRQRVVAAHVDADYRTRMNVRSIVAALDRIAPAGKERT
jgi:peroxiredoxin